VVLDNVQWPLTSSWKECSVESEQPIVFGPFHFDRTTQRLWQEHQEIRLRARARAVLHYLVEHPGRIIARQEFEQHVWGSTHVTQSVLRGCIWELRQALGDTKARPHYIETVGQQGYRFCTTTRLAGGAASLEAPFVGRQAELDTLQTALDHARRGVLQLVFVAGAPGVGKTALVRQFVSQGPTPTPRWVGSGQCIEHCGDGEAYLPLLEALGRVGRAPGDAPLVAALRRLAPTWIVHLPQLVEPDELDELQRQVQGMRTERMLREFVEALTVITQERLVVLVLEDLQWSDPATVETLAYLARRPEHLRLLVLGTYRPAEMIARGHPLRQTVQELVAHQLCQELQLELLTEDQVQAYVAQRLGAGAASAELGSMMYRRTEGNALFTVQLLDHLLQQGWLVDADGQWRLRDDIAAAETAIPDGLRALLLKQVEALDAPAQQVLAAASVSGMRFTTAAVAAMLQCTVEEVDTICDALTQQSTVIVAQELLTWPDGTVTGRYRFRHVMFSEVLYARLGMAQRARWHRLLGERIEAGYRGRARELAGALALHFERGQDLGRAVQYHRYAAEQGLRRSAYTEVLSHCHRGLELLATLPDSPERATLELGLRQVFSTALAATQGYTSEALADNLHRALTLCDATGATTALVPILISLTRLCMMRSDRPATERLLARQRTLLTQLHDTPSLVMLHTQLGTAETYRAAYTQAQAHQTHALQLYDAEKHRALAVQFGCDPAVVALGASGLRLWLTGWPDQAAAQTARALARAETLAHPLSLAIALTSVAKVQLGLGECSAACEAAQRLRTMGEEQGFQQYAALGMMTQGSVLAQRGEFASGCTLLTTGLAQYRQLGCQASLTFFLSFLAEAYLRQGQVAAGLAVVADALRLTATHFDRCWDAELHRQRGNLLLAQTAAPQHASGPVMTDAEACFQQALTLARQQGARALELRAAISLSHVWRAQGQHGAAHELVARCYDAFSEGFDTADLRTARDLLRGCPRVT
jgi:DNA-binding winged helix-turn-helix (wHTH) protein/predicted ATPase